MVSHDLRHTMSLLTCTPAALDALLRDLPDMWTVRNEGDNTWSAVDVVGHLIHGDKTDWIPRARMILQSGESQTFEPFDRDGHRRESRDRSLDQLLNEFARVRSDNLSELRGLNLRPEDLERKGRHPALGVVTLSQLLATWAVHDLTHLHQISRVMAHQYQEAVGPWSDTLECCSVPVTALRRKARQTSQAPRAMNAATTTIATTSATSTALRRRLLQRMPATACRVLLPLAHG